MVSTTAAVRSSPGRQMPPHAPVWARLRFASFQWTAACHRIGRIPTVSHREPNLRLQHMSRLYLHQRPRRAFVGLAAFMFAVACEDSPDPAGPDDTDNFLTFAAVSAGLDHTCAIVGSGDAY